MPENVKKEQEAAAGLEMRQKKALLLCRSYPSKREQLGLVHRNPEFSDNFGILHREKSSLSDIYLCAQA